jgi:prevent-host-death family protein
MRRVWQLQEARSKLATVVDGAINDGPQVIIRRDAAVAVVLSFEEYARLRRPPTNLVEYFRKSPLSAIPVGSDLSLPKDDAA